MALVEADIRDTLPRSSRTTNDANANPHAVNTAFIPAPGGPVTVMEPFRVSFTGDGIEITGRLTTPERADEMIKAITALKNLLKPALAEQPIGGRGAERGQRNRHVADVGRGDLGCLRVLGRLAGSGPDTCVQWIFRASCGSAYGEGLRLSSCTSGFDLP